MRFDLELPSRALMFSRLAFLKLINEYLRIDDTRFWLDTCRLTVSLAVVLSCVLLWSGRAEQRQEERRFHNAPQIDLKAPGVFDGSRRPQSSNRRVRYQVNATVLMPVVSVPLAHRDDVGFVSIAMQEFLTRPGRRIRTYELFSTSFPERARGLNRIGFIREAVGISKEKVLWTAHFGALSSNPESSREEVALDSDEGLQFYTIMDGFTDRLQSSNTKTHIELYGLWSSAKIFFETLVPVWLATEPEEETRFLPSAEVSYMEPLGFLGILQHSLGTAARDIQLGLTPRKIRSPFAYRGELMYLVLTSHKTETKRQQLYVAQRLVAADTIVHRIEYRILDREKTLVQQFRVWTELPTTPTAGLPAPVFPIEFEFKPRSFLELQAIQITPSSPEHLDTQH